MIQVLSLIENLPYASVPEDIVERLRQLPQTETLAGLKELIYSAQNPDLSDRAMDAILQLDPEFGKTVLLELRFLSDWEWFFCYASITFGDDRFVAPLCEILLNSQDPNTRYMAFVALERIGHVNAISALTMALNDPSEDYEGRKISSRAAIALQTIEREGYS